MSDAPPGPLAGLGGPQLLALAAHEMKGPLTALTLKFDMLMERGHGDDPARDVQLMRGELNRIGRMVEQYLVAGQFSDRPLCLEVEEMDTAALVAGVADRIALWAGEKPWWHVEPGLRAWADHSRLEQVLWNVLENAYRYGKRPIEVWAWAEDDDARIVVTDCGDGIPEEQRSVATAMFEQGHDAHRDGLGIGLGLSTAIVEAHGGRLWIERAECGGAAIHISLELAGHT